MGDTSTTRHDREPLRTFEVLTLGWPCRTRPRPALPDPRRSYAMEDWHQLRRCPFPWWTAARSAGTRCFCLCSGTQIEGGALPSPPASSQRAAFSPDQRPLASSAPRDRSSLSMRSRSNSNRFQERRYGEGSNLQHSTRGAYLADDTWSGHLSGRRASSGVHEFVQDFRREMMCRVHSADDGRP
jgi:hypothetical protein